MRTYNKKKQKALRNLDLLVKDPDRNVDPIVPMQEGDSWCIVEEWKKGHEAYQRAYNMPNLESINPDAFKEIPNQIARCYQMQGQWDLALEWIEKSLIHNTEKAEPYFYRAEINLKLGEKQKALIDFLVITKLKRKHSGVSNQYDVLRIYAYHHAWTLLTFFNEHQNALTLAEEYIKNYDLVVEAKLDVARSLLSLGKAQASLPYFEAALKKLGDEADVSIRYAYEAALDQVGGITKSFTTNLSICMIVKNEEANIADCIDSFLPLGAEVIIVDTGSTDQTKSIAQNKGAQVFDLPWKDDFSHARNHSFAKAKGNWILWLDADDRLEKNALAKIKALVKSEADKAYGFMVKNTQDNGKSGSVFNQIRLIPNDKKIRFSGKIHEQLSPSLKALKIPIEFVKVQVLHTGYTDDEVVAAKQKRNLKLLLKETSWTAAKLFQVGGAYLDLKEYLSAIEWFVKAQDHAEIKGEDPHVFETVPFKIASCWAYLRDFSKAKEVVQNALLKFPNNAEGWLINSQIHVALQEEQYACNSYIKIFAFEESQSFMPIDLKQMKIEAGKFISQYFQKLGKVEIAVAILKVTLESYHDDIPLSAKLQSILWDYEEYVLLEHMTEMVRSLADSPDSCVLLAKISILSNNPQKALKCLEDGSDIFHGNAEILDLLTLLQDDLSKSPEL
jgi:glycosyltransferase involved in cell wall biosynthesis